MIVTGVSWLLAGAVAGTLSESASQYRILRHAGSIKFITLMAKLSSGLRAAVVAGTHQEFVERYAGLLRLTWSWLVGQLRLLAAQLLVGGSVYCIAYFLLGILAIGFLSELGMYTRDGLFLVGACLTYGLCKWSRVRQLKVQQ